MLSCAFAFVVWGGRFVYKVTALFFILILYLSLSDFTLVFNKRCTKSESLLFTFPNCQLTFTWSSKQHSRHTSLLKSDTCSQRGMNTRQWHQSHSALTDYAIATHEGPWPNLLQLWFTSVPMLISNESWASFM